MNDFDNYTIQQLVLIAIGSVFIVSGILYKVCFFTADTGPVIREKVDNI